MNTDWQTDPHWLEMEQAFINMLGHGGTKPNLTDLAARPYDQVEDHPIVKIARKALAEDAVDNARISLIERLLEENGNLPDAWPLRQCVILFNAIVKNDPIDRRIALKELAKGTKRKEWNEAV